MSVRDTCMAGFPTHPRGYVRSKRATAGDVHPRFLLFRGGGQSDAALCRPAAPARLAAGHAGFRRRPGNSTQTAETVPGTEDTLMQQFQADTALQDDSASGTKLLEEPEDKCATDTNMLEAPNSPEVPAPDQSLDERVPKGRRTGKVPA